MTLRFCFSFSLLSIFLLISCTYETTEFRNEDSVVTTDSALLMKSQNYIAELGYWDDESRYFDSLRHLVFDTSTLSGKQHTLLINFSLEHGSLTQPDNDSAFDLNFDGYDDYVIYYYGSAGTGIKNGIEAYIYNPRIDTYVKSEQITSIRNPSFYIGEKKITGFYLANGGGGGEQLEWNGNQWVCTKEFSVSNLDENSEWEIIYPLKADTTHVHLPYQMIPPPEIMECDFENF
jgi:hypothetical protein